MTDKTQRRVVKINDATDEASENIRIDDASVQPLGRGTSEGINPTGRGTSEGVRPTGRGTSEGIRPTGRGTSEEATDTPTPTGRGTSE